MSVLEVLLYPEPVLSKKAEPVSEFGPGLRQLAADMMETMEEYDGVGLAAPQVGASIRMIVLREPEKRIEMCLVNPEIDAREGTEMAEEGCLSLPQLYAPVQRDARIHVSAQDLNGQPVDFHAEGLLARIVQHETDHLDGLVFLDRVDIMTRVAKGEEWKLLREQVISGEIPR